MKPRDKQINQEEKPEKEPKDAYAARRKIIDPLTSEEVEELLRQLHIAKFLVKSFVRIPDELVKSLDTLERRFNATVDEARLYAQVKKASLRDGKPLARGRNSSAFDAAVEVMGGSASTTERIYYNIEGGKRKPLANSPKKK